MSQLNNIDYKRIRAGVVRLFKRLGEYENNYVFAFWMFTIVAVCWCILHIGSIQREKYMVIDDQYTIICVDQYNTINFRVVGDQLVCITGSRKGSGVIAHRAKLGEDNE